MSIGTLLRGLAMGLIFMYLAKNKKFIDSISSSQGEELAEMARKGFKLIGYMLLTMTGIAVLLTWIFK